MPDDALILGPNKFGKAIVWLWPLEGLAWGEPATTLVRCFIPVARHWVAAEAWPFPEEIAANIAKLPELLRRSVRDAQLLLDVGHHRARQARLAECRKIVSDDLLP